MSKLKVKQLKVKRVESSPQKIDYAEIVKRLNVELMGDPHFLGGFLMGKKS